MGKHADSLRRKTSFAAKIRVSYLFLIIPIVFIPFICFYNLWAVNRSYETMIHSTVVASEFSLDFKKDFDYETYLVIVGNKTIGESSLNALLNDANRVVRGMEEITDSRENMDRLEDVKKYLTNLETYKNRIQENLGQEDNYEANIEIWENDVQIVTSLIQENFLRYIYYEAQDLQQKRNSFQTFYEILLRASLGVIGILSLITLYMFYRIPLSITEPIRRLSEVTNQVAKGDFEVLFDVRDCEEVSMLSDSLNTMIQKINELLEQVTTEQIRLRKAEFELLQSQINPHFLYNTLDAIVWLAEAGEQKKVVSMVGSLSDFFRTSLNQGKDIISIREELVHVRSYLEIQQVRYQDILYYEIDVPEELAGYSIPKITIQPLVENALYHGIKNKRGRGKIVIRGSAEEDRFVLSIEDNGIGIKKDRLQQIKDSIRNRIPAENEIYGLYNVNERIALNFGEEYGIEIESNYKEGTTVKIVLPYIEVSTP